jgi:hypothetical protein
MHGHEFSLTVSGHTHRPVSVTRDVAAGGIVENRWYANTGMLSDPSLMRYIHRSNFSGWGHAIIVGEVHSKDLTILKEGRKHFRTKNWDAEVKIRELCKDRYF